MIRNRIAASLATLTIALTLHAQDVPAIRTIEADPNFHTTAFRLWQAYESHLSSHCSAITADWSKATYKVYGKPTLAANGNIVNATWIESVPGTACNSPRRYRVFASIRGGKADVQSLLPGESFASPALEAETQSVLVKAVAKWALTYATVKGSKLSPTVTGNCSAGVGSAAGTSTGTVDVIDTRIAGKAPTASAQPWDEEWTVMNCGHRLRVPIRFVPDATGPGTAIQIQSQQIQPAV